MRFAVIAGSAAAVMTLLTQPAQAVASKVSGKYAFQEIDLCEAKLVTTTLDVLTPPAPTPGHQPVIKTISSAQPGLIAAGVGYITFTPKTTTSGNFALSSQMVEGGSLRLNNFGFTMNAHTDAVTGTWLLNSATDPTAITITATGGTAQVFSLRWADISTAPVGVVKSFYLVRKDTNNGNTNCVVTIDGRRQ